MDAERVRFWIRTEDEARLREAKRLRDVELATDLDTTVGTSYGVQHIQLLTGEVATGPFSAVKERFVLGEIGLFLPEGDTLRNNDWELVHVYNNSCYRGGLLLSPYSGVEIKHVLKRRTLTERTGMKTIEFGNEGLITQRAFITYHDPSLVRKHTERDHHFALYQIT